MIFPAIPSNENGRLKELYKYELLDTEVESDFDAIVQLAAFVTRSPMSVIALIDSDRSWLKAATGIELAEAARNVSFCGHTILQNELMEVPDAAADPRFFDNPFVLGEPNIKHYAGIPLTTGNGFNIGTLCVMDRVARKLTEEQTQALQALRTQLVKLFELRWLNKHVARINKVQENMMAVMAHDIRSPLFAIKSFYDYKETEGMTGEEQEEMEGHIQSHVGNTLVLLDNIVDWSTTELAGEAQTSTFAPYTLSEELIDLVRFVATHKKTTIVNETPKELTLDWYPSHLCFILRNFLSNATKYTSEGTITVKISVANDILEVMVADTGTGMNEKTKQALMGTGMIISTPGTDKEKGSGLGMRLVLQSVRKLHGTLSITDNTPKGTVMKAQFPY